jgi:predicted nucleic acid-binding protein
VSIVVDSSVLVAALIDVGPLGMWVEKVLASGPLHAPELAPAEATNILQRLERARRITTPEANGAQDDFMHLDIDLFPFDPFAERI